MSWHWFGEIQTKSGVVRSRWRSVANDVYGFTFASRDGSLRMSSKRTNGLCFDASEDTVWHYEALLWEAGGDITSADNKHAVFNSPAGVKALHLPDRHVRQGPLDVPGHDGPEVPGAVLGRAGSPC